ncbi:anhydro-N-acetylmuramic acid kinase [Pseudidiomarina sp.]|uniref:anhydro-N-acetylmuramic acid kinase n=1 Tax=Pseudidiomarina sp. TaxID=2081707 RepID=UPI00299D79C4|nr:anhydro-N-acetylmuramic acid kinase [Pseudidiomarina sp.]MDX1706607.1 anhydro-N-acetylmuramic acid kinase [Pseudidiomarina sp.]
MNNELFIGLMSGTSMDGLDAVLVKIPDDCDQPELLGHCHQSFPASLSQQLHGLCLTQDDELHQWATADQLFATLSADLINQLLSEKGLSANAVRAIGSHGQTVRHQPDANPAYTLQLGDPNRLAALTGIPVVADFRRKDIALGGQGAPLVPAFHHALFANKGEPRAVLNLGGIANITWLPGNVDGVLGFDTGPANTLLDQWYQRSYPDSLSEYDTNGELAAAGKFNPQVLATLLADPYFHRAPPKSTGRDDFNLSWLEQHLGDPDRYDEADIQATLIELTASSVARAMKEWLPARPETVYVAGGGAFNPVLMKALARNLPECDWQSTQALGVHPQHLEAMAFAWLAQRYMLRLPGNLPAVTGASRPAVLGGLYLPD